jgi:hypothetical protein
VLKFAYGNIGEGLDAVAVGLTAVGLSPWVARVLESFKFGGVEFKFVQKQLDEQSQDIEALKFLIGNYVTDTELDHLDRLASGRKFMAKMSWHPEIFQAELRHLRGLGLIANAPGKGVSIMYARPGEEKDVHEYFRITERGKAYLALRAKLVGSEPRPAPL